MSKPANIRNICTSAHIDHGKCISGDSRLMLGDGRILAAEQLFKIAETEGTKAFEDQNKVIYNTNSAGIKAVSLNKKTGKLEHKQIQFAWKLSGGRTIRVTAKTGLQIETTPEHKYMVLEEMEFKEKEAEKLKLRDKIICARNLPTEQARGIKGRILHALSNRGFHAKLKDDFAKSMKDMILNKGLKETALALKTELKPKSLYRCTYRGRYRVSDLAGLAKIFNIDPEKVYDNVSAVCYRTGAANGKSSLYASLPKNIERLFYIAGLFFGDGSGKNFIVGKPELAAEFIKICREELGIKTTLKEQAARTPEIITSMTLARMLNAIFDYPLKKKSHNIKASEILFSAPTSCSSQFIKGYFDCDGTVEKGRGAISITSASPQMLKDLQLLLVKFGCISIRQHDTLYIAGLSAKAFSEKIGFGLKNKQNLAEDLARKATGSRLSDLVSFDKQKMKAARTTSMNSISPHYYKYESGTYSPTIATAITIQQKLLTRNKETDILGKLLTGDLAFIEVSGIEESFQETVYDYTVADHHNFIAEGMVIHNTTFSDNLLAGAGMISEELAGKQLVLDFHEDEQQRGITIDAANVSMVYDISNEEYLINLIDTPGHVDFGGDVTRAMRAIDGSIVLVDCVEGIMPQTETVIRQALRERVKPVLFINKVDRLIKELKLTPDKMQERFIKVIGDFNKLVSNIAEKEYKEKWQVNVNEGSVCFGSAFH
ncbi:GTP-binding protein, partial [Candidatus Woesearchaeota archaeon]|nr:GTP-binding protein [Candidatus Woesearchaeota archaeon]